MSRIARVVISNMIYHIVQRGNNRQNVFINDEDRLEYLRLLRNYSVKWDCPILAYCLMSNHIHLLVETKSNFGLAKLMQGISLSYTQKINKKYERTGRLWECRYYSCVIERDTYLMRVLRYIERNPVRAKLVTSAEQYKWSSAKAHILREDNDVLSNSNILQQIDYQEYCHFLEENESQEDIEFIRQMTRQGKPLGSIQFQQEIEKTLRRKLISFARGRPKAKHRISNI